MTDDELDAIEARANAAVAGPWRSSRDEMTQAFGQHRYAVLAFADEPARKLAFIIDGFTGSPEMGQTAAFIAHAREDVPALIAEVRRLRERVSPSLCEDCIAGNGCRCWDDD